MSDATPGPKARFWRQLLIDMSIMTVIGVVLALIGPFGSAGASLSFRLGTWVMFAYLGYAVYRPIGWLAEKIGRNLRLPEIPVWIACTMIATVPLTVFIWWIQFWPPPIPAPTGEQALSAYFNVLVVGASITVVFFLIERSRQPETAPLAATDEGQPSPPVAAGSAPPQSRFLDRLPPELGTELLALEMEDHYVRAHTALGSDLVLLRLRDAIAELEGIEGMQVHRSWWVARHAVADVKRDGRNVRLLLENDLEAPVSRANVQPLKDAGWI